MKEKTTQNVHSSGGLLTNQFLERLRQESCKETYVDPKTFAIHGKEPLKPKEFDEKVTKAWKYLLERWDDVSLHLRNFDISDARQRWILPLLKTLDFEPVYLKKDTFLEDTGLKVPLSHKGGDWKGAPIIHTVLPSQDLDEKTEKGRGTKSPHDSLQIFLNADAEHLWGIVTNGIVLRILRDYYHTYTKGYIEFDLESIFEERSYSDFLALYRLAHPTRFLPAEEDIPPLEHFYKKSLAAGEKVGDELRENVKDAIEELANGFTTPELATKLIEDKEACQDFYREILHVVYRIMFLMFAEQRGMLPSRDSLYAEAYSMTRLRERAEKTRRTDRHKDAWKGLLVTFDIIGQGVDEMSVFGYNGGLFETTEIKTLIELDCENSHLLKAVEYLTFFESEGTKQRISYVDLGVEEIGSIYESLLDYVPRVLKEDTVIDGELYSARKFFLDPRGAQRKSTGSYYTHPRLVNELIKSALAPVLEDRLSKARDSIEEKEKALLSIKVCDPATGSGAFLIAANNYLGRELAKIRTGTEYPSEREERRARRDVLQHCIYGVDVNPMAVELAKVSLWINACVEDMPLNFLDHHIKCGNSLIGATPELIAKGIPDEAFKPVEGDDTEVAKKIKKRNKTQQTESILDKWFVKAEKPQIRATEFVELADSPEERPQQVLEKRERYKALIHDFNYESEKFIADTWTSAFFWPLIDKHEHVPTQGTFTLVSQKGTSAVDQGFVMRVKELTDKYRFFHWQLEFPDVFSRDEPGFDCVLGNPPWEQLQPEEQKFFFSVKPEIADLPGVKRKNAIKNLEQENPGLFELWNSHKRDIQKTSNFIRESNKYELTAIGKLNTYSLFTELSRKLLNGNGRLGIVVPIGICTDDSTKLFFGDLVKEQALVKLIGFENEAFIFPSVHHAFKFCTLTITGGEEKIEYADIAFLCRHFEHIQESERHFEISKDEFKLLNPNTRTCPVFRTKTDAELTKKIYRNFPVLLNDEKGSNPWEIFFMQGLFNMTSDSHLFKTEPVPGTKMLYEAKMFHHFDHRYATYDGATQANLNAGILPQLSSEKKKDPKLEVKPRYWISESEITNQLKDKWNHDWLLGYRGVTSNVVERTSIFSLLPKSGVGHAITLVYPNVSDVSIIPCFIANVNSLVFDYITRQKTGGTYLGNYILKQLPIIPPNEYGNSNLIYIVPRVLELVYSSWDIKSFADDVWNYSNENLKKEIKSQWEKNKLETEGHELGAHTGDGISLPPFKWDEERRANIRAQIDAYYAKLYNLTRDELRYVLDPEDIHGPDFPGETFRVLKEKETKEFGEYRTKRLILEEYDKLTGDKTVEVTK